MFPARVSTGLLLRRISTPASTCSSKSVLGFCNIQKRFITVEDAPPAPPLLLKLRIDLKEAMKAKNTAKLDALRSLLSAINSAQKSPNPITNDSQILSLIQKQISSSRNSIADFEKANRSDLVAKEQSQVDVLTSYADSVPVATKGEVEAIVNEIVARLKGDAESTSKIQMGTVMREATKVLDDAKKAFVKADVAAIVKRIVG